MWKVAIVTEAAEVSAVVDIVAIVLKVKSLEISKVMQYYVMLNI